MPPGRRFTRHPHPWLASLFALSWLLLAPPWPAPSAAPPGPLDARRDHWLWPSLRAGAAWPHPSHHEAQSRATGDEPDDASAIHADEPEADEDEWDVLDDSGSRSGPGPGLSEPGEQP